MALNGFFDFLLSRPSAPPEDGGHCAAITVWGAYTGGAPLIFGRNFDFPLFTGSLIRIWSSSFSIRQMRADLPRSSPMPDRSARSRLSMMRDWFWRTTTAATPATQTASSARGRLLIKDLEMALDYATLEGLDAAFGAAVSIIPSSSMYPLRTKLIATKRPPMTSKEERRARRPAHRCQSLFASRLETPLPGKDSYIDDSMLRHNNLASLAEKNKGKIDARRMMSILDLPQDQGGATPPHKSIYQFVFVPQHLKLWIKAPTYLDWTEIDLSIFFQRL